MSVITFVNRTEDEVGKTMALVAIATNMAINFNMKLLIISTSNKEDKIGPCYFEDRKEKKFKRGIFSTNRVSIEDESGIEGITKLARANKLEPKLVTNYTKVVFTDRLELLLGKKRKQTLEENELLSEKATNNEYADIISVANEAYDMVFVDLDNNITEDVRDKIVEQSDLVMLTTNQNYKNLLKLQKLRAEKPAYAGSNCSILLGRYDKYSKYNQKNVGRFFGVKDQVFAVPYNTMYFEATNDAGVPDMFLNLKKVVDQSDRNLVFAQEVQRATEGIIFKLREQQKR